MTSDKKSLSRRRFIQAGGAGLTTAALAQSLPVTAHGNTTDVQWDDEVDVIVCGSGAAGSIAALYASKAGEQVLLLEKSAAWGGTSSKSGFHAWIPNNSAMRKAGMVDDKINCLQYMAQYSYPHLFNENHATLGIPQNTYELLEAFYDNAAPMIDQLQSWGALTFKSAKLGTQQQMSPDYYEHSPYNKFPQGRGLEPIVNDGRRTVGSDVVEKLRDTLLASGVEIKLQHQASKLLRNGKGQVIGLQATKRDGTTINIKSRKGVVFGTGCYSHNRQYMEQYQMLPVLGSCAVATNEGDFIAIAGEAGAQMGNMSGAWRAQVVLEEVINYKAVQSSVFWPHGDSTLVVNKYGVRFGNEKRNYNDRARTLYHYDANRCEFTNLINFMIYDQRTAELKAGYHPIPPTPTAMDYVISGNTLDELASNVARRMKQYSAYTGNTQLDSNFSEQLKQTVSRFNALARKGVDDDFGRGSYHYDQVWYDMFPVRDDPRWPEKNPNKNTTMYPLQKKGPYYCIVLCPGALGTNGGPVVNKNGQVLNYANEPIAGLYAAGNCMAHPAGNAYWAAGATIGTAMTFGKIAGESVCRESIKENV